MSWTDERIDALRKLWEKGLTASQIADKLGDVSRNAVIGKAHRLGLKARPSPVKGDSPETPGPASAKQVPARKPAAAKGHTPKPVRAAATIRTEAKPVPTRQTPSGTRAPGAKVSLLDLNERICKWPIGHPDEDGFHFCGRPVNPGFPYCASHCAEAYQAQLPRDRSRSRSPMPPLPRPR